MPRTRDPDEPKIYFLPNLMTACNLACGFFAVLMIFNGMIEASKIEGLTDKLYYERIKPFYQYAILLIFASCLFDLLDGRLARLGGKESPFGQEFDSLADIISFGMAPAMLMAKAVLFPLAGKIGWGIALIYLICGAMRLARFNCLANLPRKKDASHDFRGLPIPMAAGFIASLTFLVIDLYKNDIEIGPWRFLLGGVMLAISILMISNVRYPSFKKIDWRSRGTLPAILLTIVLILLIIQFRYKMAVFLFSAYLVYGMIRPWISQKIRRGIEEPLDEDEEENEEEQPFTD
ncbi:MAG: CDP-diacylglycerol--serine O-phosphatidyltransferase [Luteolibacter sp.]